MADPLTRLYAAVLASRTADPAVSRTARLLRSGRAKMAKKLAEEAVEVIIDAIDGEKPAVIRESADLLYNLVVLWVSAGIRAEDVWNEMRRRERMLGIAEKLPKPAKPRKRGLGVQEAKPRKPSRKADTRSVLKSAAKSAAKIVKSARKSVRKAVPKLTSKAAAKSAKRASGAARGGHKVAALEARRLRKRS